MLTSFLLWKIIHLIAFGVTKVNLISTVLVLIFQKKECLETVWFGVFCSQIVLLHSSIFCVGEI